MAHEEGHKPTVEEMLAMLDRHAAEEAAAKAAEEAAAPQKKKIAKAKDALKEGARARSGLGSAKRQLDQLDKEGY